MKHVTSTATVGLLAIALLALILQGQQGASQSSPSPQAKSFSAHYDELEFSIGAAVFDEEGNNLASQSFQLPVANRPVRISATFTAADGAICAGEAVACHKSSTGECGFPFGPNFISVGTQVQIPLFEAPSQETTPFGIKLLGGTGGSGKGGTFTVENQHTSGGTVRLAFWY